VGQRLVYSFKGTTPPDALLARIRQGRAAGVVLFKSNLRSPSQARSLAGRLQSAARQAPKRVRHPLLIMTDQEGGQVRRLDGAPERSAAQIGATGKPSVAFRAGRDAGRLLGCAGINVDLAPVIDVGRSGGAIDQFERAFGSTPNLVAAMGSAFVRGLHAGRTLATAKHFPGFGAAKANTDDAKVTIDLSARTLRRVDERPYRAAIKQGVDLVMLSSAVYPSLDPKWPAALSRRVVAGELRRRHHFRGVTVTDALDTPGLAGYGTAAQRAVRAVKVGDDLLLYSGNAGDFADGVKAERNLLKALRTKQLRRTELLPGARRVLKLRRLLR